MDRYRATADAAPAIYHLRRSDARHEVDIVLEGPAGTVVGIEIKAASTMDAADARHLAWMRDELGERFISGVVFHTGTLAFQLGERISALPISTIWQYSTGP